MKYLSTFRAADYPLILLGFTLFKGLCRIIGKISPADFAALILHGAGFRTEESVISHFFQDPSITISATKVTDSFLIYFHSGLCLY